MNQILLKDRVLQLKTNRLDSEMDPDRDLDPGSIFFTFPTWRYMSFQTLNRIAQNVVGMCVKFWGGVGLQIGNILLDFGTDLDSDLDP